MIPYLDDKLYWFSTIRLLSNNDARKSIVYRASKIYQRPLFLSSAYHVRSMRLPLFYYFHTCSYLFYTIMRAGHIDWRCIQTDRITSKYLNQTGAERRVTWRKFEEKTTTLSTLIVSKVQKGFCVTNEETNGSTQRCWLNVRTRRNRKSKNVKLSVFC